MSSLFRCVLFVRVCLLAGCLISLAPGLRAAEPRQWALLIGVQEHDNKQLNLHFTENDVRRLRQTLEKRAGLFSETILQMTDRQPWDDIQPSVTPPQEGNRPMGRDINPWRPTLANFKRELPAFLAKPKEGDRVIVFFSGHGVLVKNGVIVPNDGETYLVPRDFNVNNPAVTGLKLAEVRKALDKCKASVKFLILDCCHAGNNKAPGSMLSPAKMAKEITKALPNCVVLASCNEDETSKEWDERKQGVFTYWLCRGLEGAAADSQGRVTIDDLNRYVHERVSRTARQLFNHQQSPVRFGKVEGTPVVLTLKPEAPETLCRRLAEHLDLEVRRKKLRRIGVVEFYLPKGVSDQQLAVATLPSYCANQVRQALQRLSHNHYKVIDAAAMRKATKGIVVEEVRTPAVLEQLGRKSGAMDGVVFGVLRQAKQRVNVQCELVSILDGDQIGQTGGVLPLNEELYAALKRWSYYHPERLPESHNAIPIAPPLPDSPEFRPQLPDNPFDFKIRRRIDDLSHRRHPLLDGSFPFRVELHTVVKSNPGEKVTDATPRVKKRFVRKVVDDNNGKKRIELLVGASENERFEVYITNTSKHRATMLLLMDGLNTLEQEPARIGHGRIWVLDAKEQCRIRGWTFPERKDKNGKSEIRPFKFVDAAKSVAGRQKFGESIGLITAAFYEAIELVHTASVFGVGEDGKVFRKLEVVKRVDSGRLLGVVNIRYVDKEELENVSAGGQ